MRALRSILTATALLLTPPALAATLQISPTQLQLSADTPTVALALTNSSASASVIRAQVYAWTQDGGQDVLTPTPDVIAVPPLFTLPGGATQVVRVALRRPTSSPAEGTYRLILQEVPGPANAQSAAGIGVRLRLSVPVFTPPQTDIDATLTWTLTRSAAGLNVAVTNPGASHLQVTHLQLRAPDGSALLDTSVFTYVLPGQTHQWTFPIMDASAGQALELTAETNRGTLRAPVVLAP